MPNINLTLKVTKFLKEKNISLDQLMDSPGPAKLAILSRLMSFVIPFNTPHSFKFLEVEKNHIKIKLPHKRLNLNHVGSLHAGILVVLGEFTAGMNLIKRFGFTKYRILLTHIDATYHRRSVKDAFGLCQVTEEQYSEIENALNENDSTHINLITEIHDIDGEHIATIKTQWHIKDWSKTH